MAAADEMTGELARDAARVFRAGVRAVQPERLVPRALRYCSATDTLQVSGDSVPLRGRRLHAVCCGKAAGPMATLLADMLRERLSSGVVSVPLGTKATLSLPHFLRVHEGAENNLPDEASERAAADAAALAEGLTERDLLIVMLSGGGSALLSLPARGVSVAEKRDLVARLARAGADITQLNTVRKKLSRVKGGRLAALAHPAELVALVLSDVVGDPLDLIASGPTVRDPDPPDAALRVLREFNLANDLTAGVKAALELPEQVNFPESGVHNYIVGSNAIAVSAAAEAARDLGYATLALGSRVVGDVGALAREYAALAACVADLRGGRCSAEAASGLLAALSVARDADAARLLEVARAPRVCLVGGGEPTVVVRGAGRGGRSQQLALETALCLEREWERDARVVLACGGTDGADGPTPAAGALATASLAREARAAGLSPEQHACDNDAYGLYSRLDDGALLLRTGHTGTNVSDLHILMLASDA